MRRWNTRSPWLVGVLLFAAIALVAAACASEGGDSAAVARDGGFSSDTTFAAGATTLTTVAAEGGADNDRFAAGDQTISLGSDGVDPVVFQPTDLGRDIIFTADITVAVTDVGVAGDVATREIAALGGILFGQRTTGAPNPVSTLTFKVQPEDFTEALDRLSSIGEVRSQNISASDVTERIVDLESRILSAGASVNRLRELLAEADAVTVVVQVESELLQRETQLETLRGQLRTLEDQVSLATIVVTLTEALSQPGVNLAVTAYPGHDGLGQSCPGVSGLSIDEGTEATVCFEIVNAGDTPLTGFELNDPVIDVTLEDLTPVFGEPTDTLEPGESMILAFETTIERDLRTQTRVNATPVNQEGRPLVGRSVASTQTIFLNAVDPGGVPSFGEGFSASVAFLADAGRVLILGVGVILPFIWLLPLLIWLGVRSSRKTKKARETLAPTGDTHLDGSAAEQVEEQSTRQI
ncbi:MAG: DUF4349 domain-containing protein [Acidimicrobiia bacterium]|nr:DUF4349 domain-containing protein [Acidimicrobiia bacterium]